MSKPSSGPFSDFALILFSLALGFIVWVIVRQQETVTRTVLVPVYYENLPDYIELQDYNPKNIAVSFSLAKGDDPLTSASEKFRATVDLTRLVERNIQTESFKEISLPVERTKLDYPKKLTFIAFEDTPAVTFSARLRVAMARIEVNLVGDHPAMGYRIDRQNIVMNPNEIYVAVDQKRYEQSLTNQLVIKTEPIDVTGKQVGITGLYRVLYGETDGIFPVPGRAETVEIMVPIQEVESTRVYHNIPVRYETLKRGVRAELTPSNVTVSVEGPPSLLTQLQPAMIRLTPRTTKFLDEERIGDSVETAIEISYLTADEKFQKRLKATLDPSLVLVRFFPHTDAVPIDIPLETPIPVIESTPTPVPTGTPTPTPEPVEIHVDDDVTSPLILRVEDTATTPTATSTAE